MAGPLDGYRVVELAEGVAGPYCALELADAGADVVKVESPTGDRARGWGSSEKGDDGGVFISLNRNKHSIALDMQSEASVAITRRLIERADVVVTDAGWSDSSELQYDALREQNSQLVYCSISEFGERGPWGDRPPYGELAAQLASEATTSLGTIGEPPVRMGTDHGSMYAAIYGVQAICAALLARDQIGSGQRIDMSLFGSLLAMRSTLWVAHSNPDEWWGFHLDSYVRPPDHGYQCKDGSIFFSLARTGPDQLDELYKALHMEWVKDDPLFKAPPSADAARLAHVHSQWERAFANFTSDEVMDIVHRHSGWAFPLNDYERLVNDEQVQHLGMVKTMEQPGVGPMRMLAPPWEFSDTPAELRLPAPRLGEHGREILAELGYAQDEVARYEQEGALAT